MTREMAKVEATLRREFSGFRNLKVSEDAASVHVTFTLNKEVREPDDFSAKARKVGLESWVGWGQEVWIGDVRYRVIDVLPRKRKRKVLLQNADGQVYACGVDVVNGLRRRSEDDDLIQMYEEISGNTVVNGRIVDSRGQDLGGFYADGAREHIDTAQAEMDAREDYEAQEWLKTCHAEQMDREDLPEATRRLRALCRVALERDGWTGESLALCWAALNATYNWRQHVPGAPQKMLADDLKEIEDERGTNFITVLDRADARCHAYFDERQRRWPAAPTVIDLEQRKALVLKWGHPLCADLVTTGWQPQQSMEDYSSWWKRFKSFHYGCESLEVQNEKDMP